MKMYSVALVMVLFFCACAEGTNTPAGAVEARSGLARDLAPSDDDVAVLTASNRDFAVALFHELLAGNGGGNIFISPHSISIALAMTYAGAAGNTASQMRTAMSFDLDDAALHEAFNSLDLALDERGSESVDEPTGDAFELSVVNAAWGQTGYQFVQAYLDTLAQNYGAGMWLLDFLNDPDGSRVSINDWVADESHDRIVDLLPEGAISAATSLVLTNVIYFKASWLKKFDPADTVDATFSRMDGTDVDVRMMHVADELMYGTTDGCEYLRVPYVGKNVEMLLILPAPGHYTAVETALTGDAIGDMMENSVEATGKLALPRFTFEFESALNDPLKALGMTDAFQEGVADFSGMDGVPHNLYVSLVQHKSFVAVDEEGTEAAAATAVVIDNTSVPVETFDMTFDRPFIFAIVDKPTGAVLFLGRVLDPTAG